MAKGTPVVPVRISDAKMLEVEAAIRGRNNYAFDTPWTVSDFIRKAIDEKLAHMARSRRSRGRASDWSPDVLIDAVDLDAPIPYELAAS